MEKHEGWIARIAESTALSPDGRTWSLEVADELIERLDGEWSEHAVEFRFEKQEDGAKVVLWLRIPEPAHA